MSNKVNHKKKHFKYKNKYLDIKKKEKMNIDNQNPVRVIFVRHGESTHNIDYSVKSEDGVLTEKGQKQATKTGKFLSKVFNKFDVVYSSPATRCVQTANLIMDEIGFKHENIVIDDLLVELGYFNNDLESTDPKEVEKLFNNTESIKKLRKKVDNTQNPFEIDILDKKLFVEYDKYYNLKPDYKETYENCKNFLDKVNKDCKQILVITHGGTIASMQSVLCRTGWFPNTKPTSTNMSSFGRKHEDDKEKYEKNANCCIMCANVYEDDYELISPANIYHLIEK